MSKTTKTKRATKLQLDGGLPKCQCGCGEMVGSPKSRFRMGHDARFHGRVTKLADGRLKMADLKSQIEPYALPLYRAAVKAH
jgi:hypothetical protein